MFCAVCSEKISNSNTVKFGCCSGIVHDVCMVFHMIPDPDMDNNIVECPYCDKPMQPHSVQKPQPVQYSNRNLYINHNMHINYNPYNNHKK